MRKPWLKKDSIIWKRERPRDVQDSSLQIFLPISHLNNKTEKIGFNAIKTEKLELEKKSK